MAAATQKKNKTEEKKPDEKPEAKFELDDLFDESWPPLPEYFDMPRGWESIMTEMYEEGCTNEEVIAWITKHRKGKFTQNMFYHWYKNVAQFKFVIDAGNIYKKAWWLKQGRVNIGDSKFNVPLYIRMMANLFAWRTDSSVIESVGDKVDLSKLSKEDLELYRKLRDKLKQQTTGSDGNGLEKKPQDAIGDKTKRVSEFAGTGRD